MCCFCSHYIVNITKIEQIFFQYLKTIIRVKLLLTLLTMSEVLTYTSFHFCQCKQKCQPTFPWELHSFHQLQTLGWWQIQEFGKSQQVHSVKVNWQYGVYNKEYHIFYYLKIMCYLISLKILGHIYICTCFYPEELVVIYLLV